MKKLVLALAFAIVASFLRPAEAMPLFARQYGYSCDQCHTTVPQLNAFGRAFRFTGYRLPGTSTAPRSVPLSGYIAALYTGDRDESGVPKLRVDDAELHAAGAFGRAMSYFARYYAIDGGKPGTLQEAWVTYASGVANPDTNLDLRLRAGQFYLPLPVSAETYRETVTHYAVFDQQIGDNPFNLGATRVGVDMSAGAQYVGFNAHAMVLDGRDPESELPRSGPDHMLYVENNGRRVSMFGYRVDGTRAIDGGTDRFWRAGAAITARTGPFETTALYQRGNDTHATVDGSPLRSSGGFISGRLTISPNLSAIVRRDWTSAGDEAGAATIASLIFKLRPDTKLTVERAGSAFAAQLFFAPSL